MMQTPAGETRIQLCGRLKADVEGIHVTCAPEGARPGLARLSGDQPRSAGERDELIPRWPFRPPADPCRPANPAFEASQRPRQRSLAGRDAVELQLPESTWVDIEAADHAIQAAEAALAASE